MEKLSSVKLVWCQKGQGLLHESIGSWGRGGVASKPTPQLYEHPTLVQ